MIEKSNISIMTEGEELGSKRYAICEKSVRSWRGLAVILIFYFGLFTAADLSWAEQANVQTSVNHSVLCKTDWMYRGKIGLSTHYFPLKKESVEEVANTFQVQKVANQVEESGASWFIFTLQHQNWMMMAPNETFDTIVGNSDYTPSRDIPLELYKALGKKNIKLILYVNIFMTANSMVKDTMGGWPPNDALINNIAAVYREYSLRYGNKVAAWWVDGAGVPQYKKSLNRERWFTMIANALRVGNPNALVAFNPGQVSNRYTLNSDFIAGESKNLRSIPNNRWLDGAQWHSWTYLGGFWSSGGVRFSNQELGEYIAQVTSKGGALTFDVGTLGFNREGSAGPSVPTPYVGYIDPAQIEQIKAIRKYLYPVTSPVPTNCKN
ncbi:alpha-L-fucosidase [Nitrosomonas sp. Nm34]|uniref:alpha-L-fucosidase n=1 Tax=Nitrosomonas sp. Nm34 TaxID=1881055 RepID=UPI0008E2C0CF|nr:alpha-L-fucosidase [Nitrosomonas sp. Nm34]SFI58025.1 Alpha-L-fucosidase [Nitrosomonas sp. Nm34]